MPNIFENDAFSLAELTAAINKVPYAPGRIGRLGLFEEQGVTTTTVTIDIKDGKLQLVGATPRGTQKQPALRESRNARSFAVPHLQLDDTLIAESIQNVRAFGSDSQLEAVQTIINDRLAAMSMSLDATIEFHRIGAIKGQIMDSDGTSVIYDLYKEFGITQKTVSLDLNNASANVRANALNAVRLVEDALGGSATTLKRAFCGRNFFDELIGHPAVSEAWKRWNDGEMLRNDPRGGFMFGNVIFEEYTGKVGNVAFVADDDAYLFPEGVSGMFITRFAPADYMSTVNTLGLPKYAKIMLSIDDKGAELQTQSNPLNVCTRPEAVVKLAISTGSSGGSGNGGGSGGTTRAAKSA